MKQTIFSVGMFLMGMLMFASCGNSDDSSKAGAPKNATQTAAPIAPGSMPNYRFIDTDTIGLKYNLAIDFNEQMIRLQNSLSEEEKRQRATIQSRASALQAKMNAAQSQSDIDALKGEYESIQNLQNQAQQKLQQMGMDMEKTLTDNAQVLQDSLMNFLRDYAQQKGYDAILVNSAAPYYNPALDVTDEVIEGLNARYNKVKK